MARVLVTGATGFVGRHVVAALRDAGDDVSCLVRPSSDRGALPADVRFVPGDVTDAGSLAAAVRDHDVVVHAAAMLKTPWRKAFVTANVDGARNVARACAAADRAPALLLVSSLAAAGPSPDGRPRDEDAPPRPMSLYGRVKLAAEAAARAFAGDAPLTIVRPPMVFGAGDTSALPLFRGALAGIAVTPTWRSAPLSLVHAADLADAIVRLGRGGERASADDHPGRGVYYVAADEQPRTDTLGAVIAAAVGRRRPVVVRVPFPVVLGLAVAGEIVARWRDRPSLLTIDKARELGGGAWICRADKAARDVGFRPAPLADRLRATIDGYRRAGWLPAAADACEDAGPEEGL